MNASILPHYGRGCSLHQWKIYEIVPGCDPYSFAWWEKFQISDSHTSDEYLRNKDLNWNTLWCWAGFGLDWSARFPSRTSEDEVKIKDFHGQSMVPNHFPSVSWKYFLYIHMAQKTSFLLLPISWLLYQDGHPSTCLDFYSSCHHLVVWM